MTFILTILALLILIFFGLPVLMFLGSSNKREFIIGFLSVFNPGFAITIYGERMVRSYRRNR